MATINGTNIGEILTATAGDDVVNALAGNDTLNGMGGNDILDGGTGADRTYGGLGNDLFIVNSGGDRVYEALDEGVDTVQSSVSFSLAGQYLENLSLTGLGAINGTGNSYANVIRGNDAANDLRGGGGGDTIVGGPGNDRLFGDEGNDLLDGGPGSDRISGGTGTDTVTYHSAAAAVRIDLSSVLEQDTLGGGKDMIIGIENVIGTELRDVITGNASGNTLYGRGGLDLLRGEAGNDFLYGGGGDDTLNGGNGNDVLNGASGFDTADYGDAPAGITVDLSVAAAQNTIGSGFDRLSGIERLIGSAFDDVLTAAEGDARLMGGAGNDRLVGDDGNDRLDGGDGDDSFNGGYGDDVLRGGNGNDFLYGVDGKDSIVFDSPLGSGNVDILLAFRPSEDTIRLDHAIFGNLPKGALKAGNFAIGAAAADGSDRIIFDPNYRDADRSHRGSLSFDSDGTGPNAAILFAVLDSTWNDITATDFFII